MYFVCSQPRPMREGFVVGEVWRQEEEERSLHYQVIDVIVEDAKDTDGRVQGNAAAKKRFEFVIQPDKGAGEMSKSKIRVCSLSLSAK